jgi:beta-glucanase (GH16 family)
MRAAGVSSAWYESFHTYGCLITEEDTIYYCDDIEMARHKTMPVSKAQPHYFLVNLAVGGISGWKIDLDRYDGVIDMYIDYIRVYEGL